jgi:hypothetical protein
MLRFEGGTLSVNLLLKRASAWADVNSYLPYEGRVDLKVKQPCRLVRLRAPEWIETGSPALTCAVNGESRTVVWAGRMVEAGAVSADDTLVFTFPIHERVVNGFDPTDFSEKRVGLMIGGILCSLTIKGNTVVHIDLPGRNIPLYRREHYGANQVRWRKVKRFVPDRYIEW